MSVKVHAWQDRHRRIVPTGAGHITVEPGQTCIVIVADRLTPALLELIAAHEKQDEAK